MSHILVTGENGFISSHLVNQLVAPTQHRVTVFNLYPRPYDTLLMGIAGIAPGPNTSKPALEHQEGFINIYCAT